MFPGNLCSDLLHLGLDLGERPMCLGRKLGRRDVDADLLEPERIQLGRQAEVLAGPGQYLGLDKFIPGGELILELGIRRLVALDLELVEKLADAGDEEGGLGQVFLHLGFDRRQQLGVVEPLADDTPWRSSVIGFGARLEAGVFAQADERGRPPAGRDLVVQQAAERPEDELVEAEIGDLQLVRSARCP